MATYISYLDEINIQDVGQVGGKSASLGEMYQHLQSHGIKVPYGFAIKATAYDDFLACNQLESEIKALTNNIDSGVIDLGSGSAKIRDLIVSGIFLPQMEREIISGYETLSQCYEVENVDVAVRSSSLSEDSATASYAGQQDTYLNIKGSSSLLDHIKKCYASLYTDRAIIYRRDRGEGELSNPKMSVCIQKMVRSDLGASGVAFTIDTESGFKDAIIINASYGLGEFIVGGDIDPDEYTFFKPTKAIIDKRLGSKKKKLIYGRDGNLTLAIETSKVDQESFCLGDDEISKLSLWAMMIEKHYTKLQGSARPMDIEWAIDENRELFIVQARPVTIQRDYGIIREYHLAPNQTLNPIITGTAVGEKMSTGMVKVISSLADPKEFNRGDILVVDATSPDWEPLMKLASAIVTNRGGRTCHAAIIAREQGIPAIVGTSNATEILKDNMAVTVSCSQGETGTVYEGYLEFSEKTINVADLPRSSNPKVMFNLASPEIAFKTAMLPNSGVGLAREEFIINNFIKVHPLALLNYDSQPADLKSAIDDLTKGYKDGIDYYVSKLAFGVAKIASAMYPNDVILRFSDYKTNEYRNLLGGFQYEPQEENPMIGWRGASRYYSKEFEPAFGLECLAIKRVREDMGLTNVAVMIPFCRTPEELRNVYKSMAKYGLERGVNGLRVILMCEIPSNCLLVDDFSPMIDGWSFGKNDLTQLILGLDRDSHLVSHIYDERNPAVKKMIQLVISASKKHGITCGICGQAPSDYPDFVEFLLECGIDSISITPDSLIKVLKTIDRIKNKSETSTKGN